MVRFSWVTVPSINSPDGGYERDNLRRMLRADRMESDFKIAVLRFSDDTWEKLALKQVGDEAAPDAAATPARDA